MALFPGSLIMCVVNTAARFRLTRVMKESAPFGRSISLTTRIIYANPGVRTHAAAEPHINRLLYERIWALPLCFSVRRTLVHTGLCWHPAPHPPSLSISIVDEQADNLTKRTFLVGIAAVVVYMTVGTTTHTTSWSAHTTLVKRHADPAEIIDE